MNSNYIYYRGAAKRLSHSWLRGDYMDEYGNQCLVQGVLTSAGITGRVLPQDMVEDIDAKLMKYMRYRILRLGMLKSGNTIQDAIMAWNDTGRQKTVVGALNELADEHEELWIKDERVRLTFEIDSHASNIKSLTSRIANVQADIEFLQKRIDGYKHQGLFGWLRIDPELRADRKKLGQLRASLSDMQEDMATEKRRIDTKNLQLGSLPKLK